MINTKTKQDSLTHTNTRPAGRKKLKIIFTFTEKEEGKTKIPSKLSLAIVCSNMFHLKQKQNKKLNKTMACIN